MTAQADDTPKTPSGELKNRQIMIRLSAPEMEIVHAAAKRSHLTRAMYARQALLLAADQLVGGQS